MRTPEENIYGQDPGDASVEHSYGEVRENIRENLSMLKTYPNESLEEKAIFLNGIAAPEFEVRTARPAKRPCLLRRLLRGATPTT